MSAAPFCLGAVVLAAGASSRMGRPKLLLPWNGTTILGSLVKQWRSVGASQVAMVCAPGHAAVQSELDRIGVPVEQRIVNEAPERGMFSSIQAAARWTRWDAQVTHVVIVLGDQPHLGEALLRSVVAFAAEHSNRICQPRRGGRARHPVVMPVGVFREIAEADGTLKEFFEGRAGMRAFLEVEDEAVDWDMDTPEDYSRMVEELKIKNLKLDIENCGECAGRAR